MKSKIDESNFQRFSVLKASFSIIIVFGLLCPSYGYRLPSNTASAAYQKQSSFKLKVSAKKKTKKSSIKVSGKTGKLFSVIISVNDREVAALTANRKGKFKASVPLVVGTNTVNVQASDGVATKTVSKRITRTEKKTTSKVERINSAKSYYPVFSPDGNYIVYTNGSDGHKLYKKGFNDSSNGQPITSITSFNPSFSPDGNFIIYSNDDDAQYIYKKNANDSSDGDRINQGLQGYRPVYSPDGQNIFYVSFGGQIYKKNLSDNSIGEQITSSANVYAMAVSPDGLFLIYSIRDGLYKKNTNDTSDGVKITSTSSDMICHPNISPDGENVIYSPAFSDSQQVRIKKINQPGNGELIKTGKKNETLKARYDVVYSPDGEYIIYTHAGNKYLYRKKL